MATGVLGSFSDHMERVFSESSKYPLNPGHPMSGVAYKILTDMEHVTPMLESYFRNCKPVSIENVNWIQCSPLRNKNDISDSLFFRIEDGLGIDIHTKQFKAFCTTEGIDSSKFLYKCEVATQKGDHSLKYTALVNHKGTLSSAEVSDNWVTEKGTLHEKTFDASIFQKRTDEDLKSSFAWHIQKNRSFISNWTQNGEKIGLLRAYLHATRNEKGDFFPFEFKVISDGAKKTASQGNRTPTPPPTPNTNTNYNSNSGTPESSSKAVYAAVLAGVAAVVAGTAWFISRNKQAGTVQAPRGNQAMQRPSSIPQRAARI